MGDLNRMKYKTKPLGCWTRAKELRLEYYKDIISAREKGKLLITGGSEGFLSLPAGLGDYAYLGGEPYGASIGFDPVFAQQCTEAVESRGFARDMCSYMRNYWGSMFLNRFFFGGEFPRPDFCLQMHLCDSHAKWYQQVSEHYGIPHFSVDMPTGASYAVDELKVKYVSNQFQEAIEWMEKTTGRKYHDEKLIEAVNNEFTCSSLWGEICLMNQAIPAPLDQKTLFTLYVICVLMRNKKEAADFYRELRDEVKERVDNQIAAVATERCRLLDDSQPPWSFLDIYRYLEKYGVVCVGSHYVFCLSGAYEQKEDRTLALRKTPLEQGIVFRKREEVLHELARWYLERPILDYACLPSVRSPLLISLVKQWRCQGVMMHFNRGCELTGFGIMENRTALMNAGIPVLTYEASMSDDRDVDRSQIKDRIDAFMESLGLKMLVEK